MQPLQLPAIGILSIPPTYFGGRQIFPSGLQALAGTACHAFSSTAMHLGAALRAPAPRVCSIVRFVIFLCVFVFFVASQVEAFSSLRYIPRVTDEVFDKLLDLSKSTGGTKKIGKLLDETLSSQVLELSPPIREELLAGTFLHLAVRKGVLPSEEAVGMFFRLRGVKGFRETLRKIVGVSDSVMKGHLYELRLANASSIHGFRVKHINEPYHDGLKRGPSDIDLVLERGDALVTIEAKSYTPPLDKLRADMDTLKAYVESAAPQRVIPVLAMPRPKNENTRRLVDEAAKRRGVEVILGSTDDQVLRLKHLTLVGNAQ